MNYTDIIKLLDAGYSRDDIMKMEEPKKDDQQKDDQQKDDQQKDNQQKKTPSSGENDKGGESAAILAEIKEIFGDMKKEITAMNIMGSRRDDHEKTSDDIIANIINPDFGDKRGGKK